MGWFVGARRVLRASSAGGPAAHFGDPLYPPVTYTGAPRIQGPYIGSWERVPGKAPPSRYPVRRCGRPRMAHLWSETRLGGAS